MWELRTIPRTILVGDDVSLILRNQFGLGADDHHAGLHDDGEEEGVALATAVFEFFAIHDGVVDFAFYTLFFGLDEGVDFGEDDFTDNEDVDSFGFTVGLIDKAAGEHN